MWIRKIEISISILIFTFFKNSSWTFLLYSVEKLIKHKIKSKKQQKVDDII